MNNGFRHCFQQIFCLPLLLLAASAPALAASNNAESVNNKELTIEPVLTAGSALEVVLALLLVIALIFGLGWYLKKMQTLVPGASKHNMQVLGALPVGPRERVVLVQVGEQQLLLGVAPGRVNTLQVFDKPVMNPAESTGAGGFAASLRQVMGGRPDESRGAKLVGRANESQSL